MIPKWLPIRDLVPTYSPRRQWLGYGVAVASSAAAFFLIWILESGSPRVPLYPFFTLAVIVSVLFAGFRAGLLALGLSLLYSVYLLPGYSLLVGGRGALLSLVAFVAVGLSLCGIVAALRSNIAERKQAEEEAEASAAQLRTIVESMSERVYVCDSRGRPVLTNEAFRRYYPAEQAPVYPQSFTESLEVLDADGQPVPLADWPIARALRGEQVRGLEQRVLYKHLGRERMNRYNASPVFDSQGNVIMAVLTSEDITERKQAEQVLIRTEKLASVGRLAASIAHEVNNPLAAATNAVYLASVDPGMSPQTRDALHIADQELRRAAHITWQTLGFCRETNARAPVALPQLIDEVLRVYARKLRERGITVEQRYKCGPCRERCPACFIADSGELRQVISNLLVNGMDALRDNGRLHVRLCRMAGIDGRPNIRLTIADNGCGIRAEHLKRVFEPFFTTKEAVGTGLGLWISHEIVRKYGGRIRVRSQQEKGTVFCITVPAMPLPADGERRRARGTDFST